MFKKLALLIPVIPNAGSWRTWNTSELSCQIRIGDPRSEATGVTATGGLIARPPHAKPKQIDTTSLGLGRFRLSDIATRHANKRRGLPNYRHSAWMRP